jgi:hypothetical protein
LAPLLVLACSSGAASELPPAPTPRAQPRAFAPAAEAPQQQHALDPGRPFELWFGRGTEAAGLEIVYVPEPGGGEIEVDRDRTGEGGVVEPQRGTVALDDRQWDDLRDLVRHLKVDDLDDAYVAEASDGSTQWILRIRQVAYDRTIYCAGRFPHELRRFADALDALLLDADLADNAFTEAPREAEQREQALWASIADR